MLVWIMHDGYFVNSTNYFNFSCFTFNHLENFVIYNTHWHFLNIISVGAPSLCSPVGCATGWIFRTIRCLRKNVPTYFPRKCLPPARTQAHRRWRHVSNHTFNEQRDSDCSLVLDASSQFDIEILFALMADISSIYCKDYVTYYTFDDFWDNNSDCQSCLWLFNDLSKCRCK